jgi:hypothetical protein
MTRAAFVLLAFALATTSAAGCTKKTPAPSAQREAMGRSSRIVMDAAPRPVDAQEKLAPEWKTVEVGSAWDRNFENPAFFVYDGTPFVAFAPETEKGACCKPPTVMRYNGTEWEWVGKPELTASDAADLSLFVSRGVPWLAFTEYGTADSGIKVMRFDGNDWQTVGQIGARDRNGDRPSLYVRDDTPYVAYRSGAVNGVSVMRFDGTSWVPVGPPAVSGQQAYYVSLDVSGSAPTVAYSVYRGIKPGTQSVKRFDGNAWIPVGPLDFPVGPGFRMMLTVWNDTPFLLNADGMGRDIVELRKFDGQQWVPVRAPGGSNDFQEFRFALDGRMRVVRKGWAPGRSALHYRAEPGDIDPANPEAVSRITRREPTLWRTWKNWKPVGMQEFSSPVVRDLTCALDAGKPYVAYEESAGRESRRIVVMKYSGRRWERVGDSRQLPRNPEGLALAVERGVPYLVFGDPEQERKASVARFNGRRWEIVGNRGFSRGTANYVQIDVEQGVPFVVFADVAAGGKATVMRFDGDSWRAVGPEGFTPTLVEYPSLRVSNGVPYVAAGTTGNGAYVMRFSGSTWELAGGVPFLPTGLAGHLSLAMYDGVPYVACTHYDDHKRAKAFKLGPNGWEAIGLAISEAGSFRTTIMVDDTGPWVAYRTTGLSEDAVVKHWNGASWDVVGFQGFMRGVPCLTLRAGVPYVAGTDQESSKISLMSYR